MVISMERDEEIAIIPPERVECSIRRVVVVVDYGDLEEVAALFQN